MAQTGLLTLCRPVLDDAPGLARLAGALGYGDDAAVMRQTLGVVLQAEGHGVWLARLNDRMAGWIHVAPTLSLESGPGLEISGLIVDPDLRRRGVGLALVQAAMVWARERGAQRLRVRSRIEREGALAFYQQQGFALSKTQAVLDLTLAPSCRGSNPQVNA